MLVWTAWQAGAQNGLGVWGLGAGTYRMLQELANNFPLTAERLAIAQATERAGAGGWGLQDAAGVRPTVSPVLRLRPGGWGSGLWGRSQLRFLLRTQRLSSRTNAHSAYVNIWHSGPEPTMPGPEIGTNQ